MFRALRLQNTRFRWTQSAAACLTVLVTGMLMGLAPASARAQATAAEAQLDVTFGNNGVALLDGGGAFNYANSLTIQTDGRLIVASNDDYDWVIVRTNADGSLDAGFGNSGTVVQNVSSDVDQTRRVIQQADGKLVVAGSGGAGDWDFVVARYNADGSLDTGFGTDGFVRTDLDGGYDQMEDAVQQPDGKIVTCGLNTVDGSHITLIRYNTDGSFDTGFGTDGVMISDVAIDSGGGVSLELQPDGKFVVAFDDYPSGFPDAVTTVARFNADGSLDTGFGSGGKVTATPIAFDRMTDMKIQPDGKIVVLGFTRADAGSRPNSLKVIRYSADGALDATFGNGGTAVFDVLGANYNGRFNALLLQPDGKLLAGGTRTPGDQFGGEFVLARINADGSMDTGFGDGGLATTPGAGEIVDMRFQIDGKLVAVGNKPIFSTTGGDINDVTLVRYDAGLTGTAIADLSVELPAIGHLDVNYPNPFGTSTSIPFAVDHTGVVRLSVYDLLGREVGRLVDATLQSGTYEVSFDAADNPRGAYYYQLRIDGRILDAKQMVLMR